jgi:hypothetical protein
MHIAIEWASSVLQPATHIRRFRCFYYYGRKTLEHKLSKTALSRKNDVTGIKSLDIKHLVLAYFVLNSSDNQQ